MPAASQGKELEVCEVGYNIEWTCGAVTQVDGKQRPMSGRIDLIRLGPVSFVGIVDAMRPPHTYTLSCQAKGSSVVLYEIPIADFLLVLAHGPPTNP
eukprot:gene18259-21767_t